MWGTDQAASVELVGFERLIRNIRDIEKSLGDGVKRLYDSELGPRAAAGAVMRGVARFDGQISSGLFAPFPPRLST